MTVTKGNFCDFSWNRGNLIALIVLCTGFGCAVGVRAYHREEDLRSGIRVHPQRVEAAAEKIDPNTASAGSLRRLPGLGATIAQRIVEHRTAHGGRPFRVPEDLTKIERIGKVTVRSIRPYLALPEGLPKTTPP